MGILTVLSAPSAVSERIRAARERAGLTQLELARLVGVTEKTISRYERGPLEPRRPVLDRLAAALGVSYSDLTGRAEPAEQLSLAEEVARMNAELRDLREQVAKEASTRVELRDLVEQVVDVLAELRDVPRRRIVDADDAESEG